MSLFEERLENLVNEASASKVTHTHHMQITALIKLFMSSNNKINSTLS